MNADNTKGILRGLIRVHRRLSAAGYAFQQPAKALPPAIGALPAPVWRKTLHSPRPRHAPTTQRHRQSSYRFALAWIRDPRDQGECPWVVSWKLEPYDSDEQAGDGSAD